MEENNKENSNKNEDLVVPEIPNPEEQEEELPPPPSEENEAKQVDVVNIMIIALVIFFGFVLIINFGGVKKKEAEKEKSIGNANTRYVPEVMLKSTDKPNEISKEVAEVAGQFETNTEVGSKKTDDELDEELKNLGLNDGFLNPNNQTAGTAPVQPATTTTTTVKARPDTKNSKSPRNIQGIAGLSSTTQTKSNTDIISSVLNGTYTSPQSMSRDEYVASNLERYNALYGQAYEGSTGTSGNSNKTYSDDVSKSEFYNSQNTTAGSGSYLPANSLWDGTIIKGALETAINTDNPGIVIARVTENVYSSLDHSYLLIPEGTILHGSYNSSVNYGQDTIQVAWNLLIRPDGYRLELGNMNGVNSQGASGYTASVTNHPFETIKALGLVGIFSVIHAEVSTTIDKQNNKYIESAITDVYAESSKLGNKILDKALDIKPTLKIKVGQEIKLITNTPLTLPPVEVFTPTKPYVRTR